MQPGMTPTVRAEVISANSDSAVEPQIQSILSEIRDRIGLKRFEVWCEGKIRLSVEDDCLTIAVSSPFLQAWMQKQFRTEMAASAQTALGPSAQVRFVVDTTLAAAKAAQKPVSKPEAVPTKVHQLTDHSTSAAKSNGAIASQNTANSSWQTSRSRRFADLNEFISGPQSELAVTAARQVASGQPVHFNPLYVCGPVGTGKTHLLEGICRQLKRNQPNANVVMITAEAFANYFTQALRDHSLPGFRQRFRGVDALVVDNVDFFESKRVFQEEFLHTFAELADHGRTVVLSGARHPRLLTKLSDELVSRFQSGLVCRLETPDAATRLKIVESKAAKLPGEISAEALSYIAERFRGSVRELEGALNCLHAYFTMTRKKVTLSIAREVLAELERDCLRLVRLADVERVICNLFGIRPRDLQSETRVRTVSQPRMLAMFLARKLTQSAYAEIGQHFGGRNHSTVMSAERKVHQWLEKNQTIKVASQDWTIGEILQTLEQQLIAG